MTRRRRPARAVAAALAFVLASVLVACGGTPAPTTLGAPCVTDTRAAGTFPELEGLLPRGMIEASPTTVDSGSNCTAASLGTYRSRGISELRFAGATWDYGKGDATVVAILEAGPVGVALQSAWVEEFYTAGAVNGRHTGEVKTSRPVMAGAGQVFRLETVNDLSLQTVVIWPVGKLTRVVIVATTIDPDASRAAHDQRVATAVEVAAGVPVP